MTIIHVVGARPNFMKVAPVMKAFRELKDVKQLLVHTGQHYDKNMSSVFFEQLDLTPPDVNLEVGSASHATQTAKIMMSFENYVSDLSPDFVFVYGDINSTLAVSLVCAKLSIKLVHVEAGLRSFDREMPEEINRILTDQLANVLLTPSVDGDENLMKEGIDKSKIFCVGNVMIDTLKSLIEKAIKPDLPISKKYFLVTLHRPSNVDVNEKLSEIIETLNSLPENFQIIFPVHPRTLARLKSLNLNLSENILLCEPLGYLEFLYLQKNAFAILTDSGGIQEESTWLGIPCLTLRENTERPVTVDIGTNTLIGSDMVLLKKKIQEIIDGRYKKGACPELWDGNAGQRIAKLIYELNEK